MLGLRLLIFFRGKFVGKDVFGNRYYRQRRKGQTWKDERRWVLYKGIPEASKVPSLWYGWLHHTMESSPETPYLAYAWEKPHLPNLTGTSHAYYPQEVFWQGKKKVSVAQAYQSWSPEGVTSKKG